MSTLTISLVQSALHWENKAANLEMFQRKIEGIENKTELILLPEMFSTGFSMNKELLAETMDGETIQWMKHITSKKGAILTGSFICKEELESGFSYFNRLVWMLPNGSYGFYDKRHLFAYGKEDLHFQSGNRRLIASVNGWRINLQICYDLRFPVWSRQNIKEGSSSEPEFDLLIYIANWPTTRIHAWKTLLQARAIENQCYVAGLNRIGTDGRGLEYPGGSMLIGPLGEIIVHLGSEETIFSHTLDREDLVQVRNKFPFWRDADTFFIQP